MWVWPRLHSQPPAYFPLTSANRKLQSFLLFIKEHNINCHWHCSQHCLNCALRSHKIPTFYLIQSQSRLYFYYHYRQWLIRTLLYKSIGVLVCLCFSKFLSFLVSLGECQSTSQSASHSDSEEPQGTGTVCMSPSAPCWNRKRRALLCIRHTVRKLSQPRCWPADMTGKCLTLFKHVGPDCIMHWRHIPLLHVCC